MDYSRFAVLVLADLVEVRASTTLQVTIIYKQFAHLFADQKTSTDIVMSVEWRICAMSWHICAMSIWSA